MRSIPIFPSFKPRWSTEALEKVLPWNPIESTPENLLETLIDEMTKMYWDAVSKEIGNIILTLKLWQQEDFAETLSEEKDGSVHGFDTFLDQVSENARRSAFRYSKSSLLS